MAGRLRKDDIEGRRARAERILDVAAQLFARLGYDKTSIDDIARKAHVAKGTIYLHWKTRDALFLALLRRERLAMVQSVKDGMTGLDEVGPRELFRQFAFALMNRPLLGAVLLRDREVLGKLADQRRRSAPETSDSAWRSEFTGYLETMRKIGAIRTDQSLEEQVVLVSATFMGIFVAAPLMPDDYSIDEEQLADLLADMIHRGLATAKKLDANTSRAMTRATVDYVVEAQEIAQHQLDTSLGFDQLTARETTASERRMGT